MHRQEGACYIKEIVDMKFDNKSKEYLRLLPLLDGKASVYVSMDAEKQKNIRPIVNSSEFKDAQQEVQEHPLEWLDDQKQRFGMMTKNISSFGFKELLLTLSCLRKQNEEKKLSPKDTELMAAAQRLVYSELAIMFDTDYEIIAAEPQKYILLQ